MLYMDPGRVESKQKLRQETGHCDVFTFTIYYLLSLLKSRMQIKVHDTSVHVDRSFTAQMSKEAKIFAFVSISNLHGGRRNS